MTRDAEVPGNKIVSTIFTITVEVSFFPSFLTYNNILSVHKAPYKGETDWIVNPQYGNCFISPVWSLEFGIF